MGRPGRIILAALAICVMAALPASGASAPPAFSTVVVVLAPYLTWDDVDADLTPGVYSIAAESALGCVSVRAGSLGASPSAARGAAVLSAGRPVDAPAEGDTRPTYGPVTLGSLVREAGGRTVALGTSAGDASGPARAVDAPARVVAWDADGIVNMDGTGPETLRPAPDAAAGVRSDLDMLEWSYRGALAMAADRPGSPLLIVIDPGDPVRAREAGRHDGGGEPDRTAAARSVDAVVRMVMRSLPDDAALLVVSTAQARAGGPPGFGPAMLYGAGPGILDSPATRRTGIVTLPDVTAAVLSLFSLEVPPSMVGAAPGVAEDVADDPVGRVALMQRIDAEARALETVREPVWFGTIAAAVVALIGALALALSRPGSTYRHARTIVAYVLVAICAVPVATLLAQVVGRPDTASGVWARLVGAWVVVMLVTVRPPRAARPRGALLGVAALTVLVVVLDQLTGGHAANGSVFSYSALFGARFYGLGNEGAAVVVGALLALVGLRIDRYGGTRAREYLWFGLPLVAVAVVPVLGANIGVVAWGVAGFFTAYLVAARRRLDRRTVLGALAAGAAVLLVALAADSLGPGTSHLGRLVGGESDLGAMLARKVALSLGILTATPIVVLLPVALAALVYVLVRQAGPLGEVVSRERGTASALAGGIAAAVAGVLTEDSGVALSAIVMLFPAALLAVAALEVEGDAGGR